MKATAKFYAKNPKAKAKKAAYDTKFESTPSRVKYRSELNKYNRKHGSVGDGKDASHKQGRISGLESATVNRGRNEKSRLKGSKRK